MPNAEIEDYQWLVDEVGRGWIDHATDGLGKKSMASVAAHLRQTLSPIQTHLVLAQVTLRRRAAKKFSQAANMFFCELRLQQSTSETIAKYKAASFPHGSSADLCCGLGGDAVGLALHGPTTIVDRDPICCLLAQANLSAYSQTAAATICDDVDSYAVEDVTAWHLDPDRRVHRGRTTQIELGDPDDQTIGRLLRRNENGIIKLAPSCVVPADWEGSSQLEWIGHERECKQLVARFGALAESPGQRVATMIGDDSQAAGRVTGTGHETCEFLAPSSEPQGFLYEPQAAVRAAKLVNALANKYELKRVTPDDNYLTGPLPKMRHDQSLTCFEILATCPFDRRQLKRALKSLNIGHIEVKSHVSVIDPMQEQKRLRGTGECDGCLFVFPFANRLLAAITRRI